MFRVLIVEDEVTASRYLADLVPQCSSAFEVSGVARNGADGMVLFGQQRPDLVLTDIRMPVMDGLELATRIFQEAPEVPVVIVSGYEDFTYARRALGLGVVEYLLKPVEPDLLADMLTRIALVLGRSRRRSELRAALSGKTTNSIFNEPIRLAVAIGGFSQTDLSEVDLFEDGAFDRIWYLSSANEISQDCFEAAVKAAAFSSTRKTGSLVFGIRPWVPAASPEEPRTLATAAERQRVPGKSLIHWGNISEVSPDTLDMVFAERFRNLLRVSAWGSLKSLVYEWASDPDRSLQQSSSLIRQLLLEVQRERVGSGKTPRDWELALSAGLDQAESSEDVADLAWQLVMELSGESVESEDLIDSPATIREICRWTRDHHAEPLSLSYLCSRFRISQSSLSRLFRKYKGTTFHDYLTGARMKAAEALMKADPNLPIKTVAFAVGYPDPSHFSRVYKARRGIPPSWSGEDD